MPEAWLRGPVAGVPAEIQPAAHALVDAHEEIRTAVTGLGGGALWARPGGAASVGFHLRHVAGSLDGLLTYARGYALDEAQLAALANEADPGSAPGDAEGLLTLLDEAVERALHVYRTMPTDTLGDARKVGRAGLPSTVRGLLFHAAEHTRRHAGQVIATVRIVRGLGLGAHLPPGGASESAPSGSGGRAPATSDSPRIRPARAEDRDELVRMRRTFWPDSTAAEVDDLLAGRDESPIHLVADAGEGRLTGFAEVGTRAYAEGCDTSPVAYLEGIWVDPDARGRGVAAALLRDAEAWALGHGLRELASDALVDDTASHAFHRAVGFEVVDEIVGFRRDLVPDGAGRQDP